MNRTDEVLHLLKIRHPIIQAPMAGVSTPRLAAAVSEAGALGSIGIGASTPDKAREMIVATRALTGRPFNVNVFCHRPALADPARESAWLTHLQPWFESFGATPPAALGEIYKSFLADRTVLEMLLQERPAVVSFHFGVPPVDWVRELHEAGIVTLGCATTPEEAGQIEAAGVDVIIAQGAEAGGHRGVFDPAQGDAQLGTLALVRLIAMQTQRPVVAAGGIMDGQGIAAALQLGAAAAQLGTAFILCPESAADANYRAALSSERARHTAITAAISGRPARGLTNRFVTDLSGPTSPPVPDYPIAYDAAKRLHVAAGAQGSSDFAAQWAGQGAPLARALPAAELVDTLMRELAGGRTA
ncbi:nitronate monooxygenase [Pandoraea sp.]|uniref:NAD(P)H-dependent flavin oxidoreductase n=1 Tax=Pandoraea sp. TaxID=1883445 RepID=UPI0012068821|nr:nitronate monooxygenase [Pandoraea sp.]TAL56492.1 MAG: nitronate monooxygenase [Pandoraea sp.]TAM15312.1 MAG: nitronate monooxygenase [Pandoraea sp.]